MVSDDPQPGSGGGLARLVWAAVLCVALASGTPGAAAETVRHADAVGDVVADPPRGGKEVVPDRRLNDISQITLTQTGSRVRVRIGFQELRRKAGGSSQNVSVKMITEAGIRRRVELEARRRHWDGVAQMYDGRWKRMDCPVRHTIAYRTNVISMSFPRSCAEYPRWLRFRVGTEVYKGVEGFKTWVDDGMLDDPMFRAAYRLSRWERRVHAPRGQRVDRVDAGLAGGPASPCPRS